MALNGVIRTVLAPAAAEYGFAVAKNIDGSADSRREVEQPAVRSGKRNAVVERVPRNSWIDRTGIGGELALVQSRIEYRHAETTGVVRLGIVLKAHAVLDRNPA